MNKKLPFEEALKHQLSNVPLPDEETSWQKMQEMLDKKKKRRFFWLFSFHSGCLTICFLLLTGLGLLLFVSQSRDKKTLQKVIIGSGMNKKNTIPDSSARKKSILSPTVSASRTINRKANNLHTNVAHIIPSVTAKKTDHAKSNVHGKYTARNKNEFRKAKTGHIQNLISKDQKTILQSYIPVIAGVSTTVRNPERYYNAGNPGMQNQIIFIDTSLTALCGHIKEANNLTDDATRKNADSTGKDSAAKTTSKNSPKKFHLSGGVGLQQQVPVFGQKPQPYGRNGKSSVTDYTPSSYIRFDGKGKWFLQVEFSYAAPRLVKALTYDRYSVIDSSAGYAVTIGTNVKKIFYTQVPLNFNYYIRPNWSVGAGGAYSLFHSAVTEKETDLRYLPSPTGIVTKEIIPVTAKSDTSRFRSNEYVLLQTSYEWKRFSAGLRFTRDVQPYIRFPLPDGSIANRRNWSLGFTLRYAVWTSGK